MDESEEVRLLLEELEFSEIDIYHLLTRLKTLKNTFSYTQELTDGLRYN